MNSNGVCVPLVWLALFLCLLASRACAETVFVEAESMQASSNGWLATSNDRTRRASRVKTMWGADGAGDAIATTTVRLETAGRYRVWVRYMQVAAWRGPFRVAVSANGKQVAEKVFDLDVLPVVRVESVRRGLLQFERREAGVIRITLPLDASDFVTAHNR